MRDAVDAVPWLRPDIDPDQTCRLLPCYVCSTISPLGVLSMLPNDPVEALELSYRGLLDLCDILETIADTLPQVDARLCLSTADTLEPLVAVTHDLEEDALFPMLAASNLAVLTQTMVRLRREHLYDRSSVGEVGEILRAMATGQPGLSPDAIGYLLRSFFEGTRRHVRGELELIQIFQPKPDKKARH